VDASAPGSRTTSHGHSSFANRASSAGHVAGVADDRRMPEQRSHPIAAGTASPTSTGLALQYSAPWFGFDVMRNDAMDGCRSSVPASVPLPTPPPRTHAPSRMTRAVSSSFVTTRVGQATAAHDDAGTAPAARVTRDSIR
jgi:hypothetical protein